MKTRKEIDTKYKINTKDLFESDKEFKKELKSLYSIIDNIKAYENKLFINNNLCEALKLDTDISRRIERLFIYAHLHNDFDLTDRNANELYGQVIKLHQEYAANSSYLIPEITTVNYDIIDKLIKGNNELKEYERCLKELFRLKKHILSNKEEVLLSKLSDTFGLPEDIHSKLLDADLKFGKIKDEAGKEVELTSSNYATFIESDNRDVRINAFKEFYKGYESIINTTTTALAGEVKCNNILASIRNYDSALDSSLKVNNVDKKVYKTLLDSINNNLSIIYRQWDIRKKALSLKELHIYDTYVPLVKDYNKKYSFEDAKELVLKSLSILGQDYINILNEAFDNNWIDVYPTKNKRSGGYCTAAYLAHPYVLLNFDGRFDEVSTIAHELGHAMHYYYAIKSNTYQDYGYSIFVAEVASQVNELLMSYYMLDHSNSKEEKLFILDELMKRFKASVVRQTMFSEFELLIHEKEQQGTILTKELLNDTYYELNKKYYGKNVYLDDEIKYEWSRIPHFYYKFYVYQYSTGYIAALKIAKDIYNKVPGALDKYLDFLKLGCTKPPVESLIIAGCDLTKKETFKTAFEEFDKVMNEFENLKE